MLSGAVAMGSLLAGVFFLRFWRQTRDWFFLAFTACFWLEGASRIVATVFLSANEDQPLVYLVRLLAYLLIIVAIWQKNRPRGD
jgi:hypothetical protein